VPVTVNATPAAFITPNGTLCSNDLPILLTANDASGTSTPSYQWKKNGVNVPLATNTTYSATTTGSYSVIITSSGCPNESSPVVINTSVAPIIINPANVSINCGDNTNINVVSSYSNSYAYSAALTIPTIGTASSYPASVVVSGVPIGAILKSVTLNGLTHTFPADIDMVLQSPTNTNVILMSDEV
jgi:hypothetical protein